MTHFEGFPSRMQFTPIPNVFFSRVLPHIGDEKELKVTLYVLNMLYGKKGFPQYVTEAELCRNPALRQALGVEPEKLAETVHSALDRAVERGTCITVRVTDDNITADIYLLNTDKNRQAAARIQQGNLQVDGLRAAAESGEISGELPDIFTLYEQNIGLLTPLIADELKEAEKLYPENWIRDAVREAVAQNKRKWSYIAAILERWSLEGREDGAHRGHTAKDSDPDKYVKGKYGHMVNR